MGLIMAALMGSAPLSGGVGLGFEIGDPTAFNVKIWQGRGLSPVIAAGVEGPHWHLHGDFLWHYPIETQSLNTLFFIGPGIKAEEVSGGGACFGPRMPMGMEIVLREIPLDFFGEIAPSLEFYNSDMGFEMEFGFGLRFTLK